MGKKRYLTKSRFKLACECPTKLFYTGKKDEYADNKMDDPFLAALAEGGFQVGALAKEYYPDGHDIIALDHASALAETDELLKLNNVVIFEAAIQYKDCFIRVDILEKAGNRLNLMEVKAKSVDSGNESPFIGKRGDIDSNWEPYLLDVAFQRYVTENAFPAMKVGAYLTLVDRNTTCPTDGLNQKFYLAKDEYGRIFVKVTGELGEEDLSEKILCTLNVDKECELLYESFNIPCQFKGSFGEQVEFLSEKYKKDEKIPPAVTRACGKCEFQAVGEDIGAGKKNGRHECWESAMKWQKKELDSPTIFDIWNYNYHKQEKLIIEKRIKLSAVREDDIGIKPAETSGISPSERQWLQVQKVQKNDSSFWIDSENLKQEFGSLTFPLHFIDFETAMPAIPFNRGRHPYEGLAFQFSHHIVRDDGSVEHAGQYLNTSRGEFPNYAFIRALKSELECDEGSIFRYSPHENTYLNMIYRQLKEEKAEVEDKEEMLEFIRSISHSKKDSTEKWAGKRDMVDLWVLEKKYYYDPYTQGSNSIKQVLPAVLKRSDYLQEKYSKPIYGAANGIPSLNFKDRTWITCTNGKISDPYKNLPKLFKDAADRNNELLTTGDELNDGGAAMTAYARMQFTEMSDYEFEELRKALLMYCELDTLAMVMIYEGWREMIM